MSTQTLNSKRYGSLLVQDSGIPHKGRECTTFIIFHGLGFHSAIFDKLFALVGEQNIRLVTVNRRGYPGSEPLSDNQQAQLNGIAEVASKDPASAADSLMEYIAEDAHNTHAFLVEYIQSEGITVEGGIVLAGWSLGAVTMLGLLANAGAFSSGEVDLRSYIKHVVLYDIPSCFLGCAPPPDARNILLDPSVTPGEALKLFPNWISSYYAHNEDISILDYKGLESPPPTMSSMSLTDIQRSLEIGPALPGGGDERLIQLGVKLEVYGRLKEAVMFPKVDERIQAKREWDTLEINHVWCDKSMWEMPWAAVCLQKELEASRNEGKATRKVNNIRLRDANHFCHWDQPELALQGLLSGL